MFFSLPVLMYHSISRFKSGFCVPPESFDVHCKTLTDAGWRGISLLEAEDYFLKKRRLPRKTCLFTFDDGYLDNYVHAEPILRRYGHQGILFPVAECLNTESVLRPNADDLGATPDRAKELPDLDLRAGVKRAGALVSQTIFCSWREVVHMHHNGVLAAAPHSLRHDRVVRSLEYSNLCRPAGKRGFFSVPPYPVLWGMPAFDLGHFLASPGYTLAPELFELIKNMVPQGWNEAKAFLAKEENRQAVQAAVGQLPCLGVRETEPDYRARIFQEFVRCRDIFTEKLGTPPVSFCWPWGRYSAIALEEAKRAGFRVFFTTERGANRRGGALSVRRISVRNWSSDLLMQKVSLAANAALEEPYGWWAKLYQTKAARQFRQYIRSRF